jgi:hypothetical protein
MSAKRISPGKKLSLAKETLRALSEAEVSGVVGGSVYIPFDTATQVGDTCATCPMPQLNSKQVQQICPGTDAADCHGLGHQYRPF